MRLRKLLVVLTTVALVLGTVATASAAGFSDVAGTKYADAAARLTALKILAGFPDGTFRPQEPVTRAQMAAIIVRALGLESAAQYVQVDTKFTDVAASHWASGYINVATDQGILNGYPDGSFKPEAQVTYAEALAMILRALGYEPTLKGAWPTKYLVKAAELGITSGVSFSANAPATRGDVAALVDNSLTVAKVVQVGYGDQAKYVVSGTEGTQEKALLGDLGYKKIDDAVVTDVGALLNSGVDAGKVKVKVGTKEYTYTLTDASVDPRSLVGLTIDAWVDDNSGEMIAVTDSNTGDVKTGYVVAADPSGVKIGKASDYKTYSYATDAVKVFNHRLGTPTASEGNSAYNEKYLYARYVLKNDQIVMIDVVDYGAPRVVDEVSTANQRIYAKAGGTVSYSGWTVSVTRDGAVSQPGDLKENDVFYVWSDSSTKKMVIEAYSAKVTGTLDAAAADWSSVTVAGGSYSLIRTNEALLSTDEGDTFASFDSTKAQDMLGKSVTLLKGFGDKVVALSGRPEPAVTVSNYAIVWDVVQDSFGDVYARLVTSDGKKVNYQVTSDTKFGAQVSGQWVEKTRDQFISGYNGSTTAAQILAAMDTEWNDVEYAKGTAKLYFVTFKLTSDGKLSVVKPVTATVSFAQGANLMAFSDKYNRISYGSSVAIRTSDTVLLDLTGWSTVKVVGWDSAKGAQDVDGAIVVDSGDAVLVAIDDTGFQPSADVAAVVSNELTSSGRKLVVNAKGTLKTLVFDDSDLATPSFLTGTNRGASSTSLGDVAAGDLVQLGYASDGSLNDLDELAASVEGEVESVAPADLKVKVGGTTYLGDENTVIYDSRGAAPEKVDFSALRRGDFVQLFMSGGVIAQLKIVNPAGLVWGPNSTVERTSAASVAAGSNNITLNLTVNDPVGNPVVGRKSVTVSAGQTTWFSGTVWLDANGQATVTFSVTTAGAYSGVVVNVSGVQIGTFDVTVTPVAVSAANSSATIDQALAPNTTRTVTVTLRDAYGNVIANRQETIKIAVDVTNANSTTAESYTVDGQAVTADTTLTKTATTDANGQITFQVTLPASIDAGDGISIQVQDAAGNNIGSAFSYSAP